MKIVSGFKTDNYEFVVDKSFGETHCTIKGKDEFFTYEIVVSKHINPSIIYNKQPYQIKLYHKGVFLETSGVKTNNYFLKNNTINIINLYGDYYVESDNEKFLDIKFEFNQKERLLKEAKDNEELTHNKRLYEIIEEKFKFYREKFCKYFKKIKNKTALEFELRVLIETSFDEEYNFIPLKESDFKNDIFDLCLEKEQSDECIKSLATFDNFIKYTNVSSLEIEQSVVNEIFNKCLNAYFSQGDEYYFKNILEEKEIPKKKKGVRKFFDYVEDEIKNYVIKKKIKECKNKLINNLEKDKDYIDNLVDSKDFTKWLNVFMLITEFESESLFVEKFNNFLKEYKEFQKYYLEVNKCIGVGPFVFDMTNETKDRFNRYEKAEIVLEPSELAYYNLIYLRAMDDFNRVLYIKNTKRLKPTFSKLPMYIKWAKEFISWMETKNIIDETGNINQSKLHLLNTLPKNLYNKNEYFDNQISF